VIYAVNRVPVSGLAHLRALLDNLPIGSSVVVQLQREGELKYVAFMTE
jgi:S1-C subfamily serine protease